MYTQKEISVVNRRKEASINFLAAKHRFNSRFDHEELFRPGQ
jgi:hypothetical protein